MNAKRSRFANGVTLRLASSAGSPHGRVASAPSVALTTASNRDRPIGVALIASPDLPGGRVFLCDPSAHVINVLDHNHQPVFAFGGFGSRLGQFDRPTDVAIVWIDTVDPDAPTADSAILVVADRGNHRLQMFDLDGAPVGAIGGRLGASSTSRCPDRSGWPFFRLGSVPSLPFPSRLEWRTPYLDVACGGTMVRLDLAAALLPDFHAWIADASPLVLRQAFDWFAADPTRSNLPDWCWYEIMERLNPAPSGVAAWSWRGCA
jgi:hypothetical protein